MKINDKYNGIFSFEEGIPSNVTCDRNSNLAVSSRHFKDGKHSLKWDFMRGSQIVFEGLVGYHPFIEGSLDQARDTFGIWVYCEKSIEDKLIFKFGRKDTTDCSFTFGLNFTGWRTAWVAFERDMEGCPHPDMDKLVIKAPERVEDGTIYIDQVIMSTPVDPRHQTRDYQVPFVNVEADKKANSHWLSLYYFSTLASHIACDKPVSEEELDSFKLIERRYEEFVFEYQEVTEGTMDRVREEFKRYGIIRNDGVITGNVVDAVHHHAIYPKGMREYLTRLSGPISIKDCTGLLFNIAHKYRSTDNRAYKVELMQMFLDMTEHLLDQGWADGSSLGTAHHLGYLIRDYYPAMFLMREVLRKAGLLKYVQKAMGWISGVGRIFQELGGVRGESMDTLNTLLQGMQASILMMENICEKAVYMKRFSEWLSHCMLPAPGLKGPFKVDGSAYHHCNHYPAYALGGLTGAAPVVYFLSGTPYRITEEAHKTIKKALMAIRLYSNKYQWLVSLSARHPKGKGEHCQLRVFPFKYMALAGTPDGRHDIDHDVAAAYLRLAESSSEDETCGVFMEKGISAEDDPNGHWTMNYAALAIHRRDHWLSGVRGHSRYIWANESYRNANLYGRYISHGHLQILGCGNPINNADSGFVHDGWDWNRWPGTTTIHLPFELLRSDVQNVDTFSGFEEMLLSDETYAGGVNIDGMDGMFAMKLHEHPKYNGTHRARKSFFFFDNRIICIGTNIENENGEYATETTMFQSHLSNKDTPTWVNGLNPVTDLNYHNQIISDRPIWLLDNNSNGYYAPGGQKVMVSRSTQNSKAQNTGDDTKGDFAVAWIDHGKAPKEGAYEYAVVVGTNPHEMHDFTQKMSDMKTRAYTVLQADRQAHIVKDNFTNTIGYALFEAGNNLNAGLVKAVDTPVLVMTKETDSELLLSICDPDLRLYTGIEEDQYDSEGNRIEVSLYSRKWRTASSQPSTVTLTIDGEWVHTTCGENYRAVFRGNKNTVLRFDCKDAMPIQILLKRG